MLALRERSTITFSLRTTWDWDRLSLRTLLVGRFLSVKLTPSSPDAGPSLPDLLGMENGGKSTSNRCVLHRGLLSVKVLR
jgi:hypothetical protein